MLDVDASVLKEVYKTRPEKSHKGNFGKLLIIGGSRRYTGAPALASYAAISSLRAGVDMVMVAAPERAADVIARFSPNLITEPFKGEYFTRKHIGELMKLVKEHDAVCIGSGFGMEKETQRFVKSLIEKIKKPCVVDADAIKALKGKKYMGKNFVLTPHAYEFYHISGEKPKYDVLSRAKMVKGFSKKTGCIVLLKGPTDIISDGEKTAINKTGNPYMTTGGTGDVLAGVCGGILAQKVTPFTAACAAAYITGKAGDIAAKSKGPGLMATDVIEKLADVVREVVK